LFRTQRGDIAHLSVSLGYEGALIHQLETKAIYDLENGFRRLAAADSSQAGLICFVFGDRNTSTYIFSVMTYVASCLFCFLSIKHLTSSGAFCRRGSAALGQFASAIVSSRIFTDPDAIAYNTNHNLSINPTGGTFAGVQGGPGDHGAWGCACVRALFRVIACCNKHWAWHCASTRSSNGTGHGPVQLLKLFT
jgi:hypothetical protein